MKVLLIFLFVCSLHVGTTLSQTCHRIFRESCIDEYDFPLGVAHGIHSLTLHELRYFFDKHASETNKIPMVNFNLSSPILVLPSAPDLKLNNTYITPSMQSVDHILSNWENEDFFMKGASVLELLVHNLHMYESLKVSGKIYRKIKKNPGENVQKRCKCIIQSENLILDQLEQTAKRFRIMADSNKAVRRPPTWRGYYGGRSMFRNEQINEQINEMFLNEQINEMFLNEQINEQIRTAPKPQLSERCDKIISAMNKMIKNDPEETKIVVQPLENSTIWKDWKIQLNFPKKGWNYELANYIYCKLNMD